MRANGEEGTSRAVEDPDADARARKAARLEAELSRLVRLAAGGDEKALAALLALIRQPIMQYCRARLGTGGGISTAEDVAQDVLIAVCGALKRYRPGEKSTMAFIYGIARFKVVDAFRAAGRDRAEPTDQLPDLSDDTPGPELTALLSVEIGELRQLLDLLPEAQREVLVLRVALGLTGEETARLIGSTPGAVRVTQHRALKHLRALAAEWWPAGE